MKTKLITLLMLLLPICCFSQNYEKEGDDLFSQAQYEQAEKKYKAAITIIGETPSVNQKLSNCSKCRTLLAKAQAAEKESRYNEAAKYYSDLYNIHSLAAYQSKANAMKQKARQVELAEQERQAKLAEERRVEQERQARIEQERRSEQERQSEIDAKTIKGTLGNNFSWQLYEGVLTIYGEGYWEDFGMEHPWSHNGLTDKITSAVISDKITRVTACAFYDCRNLTSVTIPNSVTEIGRSAFSGCINLKSIVIPNSVYSIGVEAFNDCRSLSSVSIPYGVKYISTRCFANCSKLTSITLPNSITSIGFEAFMYCRSLSSIQLPNKLEVIDQSAFKSCRSLSSIVIPVSVKRIYYSSFDGCSTSIQLPRKFENKLTLPHFVKVTYY